MKVAYCLLATWDFLRNKIFNTLSLEEVKAVVIAKQLNISNVAHRQHACNVL